MAKDRPSWISDLSRSFKRHRQGRPGWFIELRRESLYVLSMELPPRPDEPADAPPKRRVVKLSTPPGPNTIRDALSEACAVYDAVMAGTWSWPAPGAPPIGDDPHRLTPLRLQPLIEQLQSRVVGEVMTERTWGRTYAKTYTRLLEVAGQRHWPTDRDLIETVIRRWPTNSRARQMAYDRLRRLWKEAGWPWPDGLSELRGNGKAAANPEGVRAFTDAEIDELRARIQRSKLTAGDLLGWDLVIVFGLRPAELEGLELFSEDGLPMARVTRSKKSSRGSSGARTVPAVPPAGWPADCHGLLERWQRHGLPQTLVATSKSPGQMLSQQLYRLQSRPPVAMELDPELSSYSAHHAFAIRLATELGLHPRESATLMGHSPMTHLQVYGRRLDRPGLLSKVRQRVLQISG